MFHCNRGLSSFYCRPKGHLGKNMPVQLVAWQNTDVRLNIKAYDLHSTRFCSLQSSILLTSKRLLKSARVTPSHSFHVSDYPCLDHQCATSCKHIQSARQQCLCNTSALHTAATLMFPLHGYIYHSFQLAADVQQHKTMKSSSLPVNNTNPLFSVIYCMYLSETNTRQSS